MVRPPAGQSRNNYIVIDHEVNHHLTYPSGIQPGVQVVSLSDRPRITIQNETMNGIRGLEPLFDQ